MFQLVNLIFSSRESVVKFASAIVVALGSMWFSLLLYSTTVIYNINFVVSFLSCICFALVGFLRMFILALHYSVAMLSFVFSVCFICTWTQTV